MSMHACIKRYFNITSPFAKAAGEVFCCCKNPNRRVVEQEPSFLRRLRYIEIRLVIPTAFVMMVMKNRDELQNDVCNMKWRYNI